MAGAALVAAVLAVIGGEVDDGDPAAVQVEVGGAPCSGALIGARVVMTAAHCLGGAGAGDVVRFGTQDPWVDEVPIVATHVHRGGLDLGFVRLARAVTVAPLPVRAASVDGLDALRVIGFGRTAAGDPASGGVKHAGALALLALGETTLTAGGPASTCEGDSGGPALDDAGQLAASVSGGEPGCAGPSTLVRLDRAAVRGYLATVVAAWDGACVDDADCGCPFDAACPSGGFGDPCTRGQDCATQVCDGATGLCSQPCGPRDECPRGSACAAAGAARLCRLDDGGCCNSGGRAPIGPALGALAIVLGRRRRRVSAR